jgi:hypothetical protein
MSPAMPPIKIRAAGIPNPSPSARGSLELEVDAERHWYVAASQFRPALQLQALPLEVVLPAPST